MRYNELLFELKMPVTIEGNMYTFMVGDGESFINAVIYARKVSRL